MQNRIMCSLIEWEMLPMTHECASGFMRFAEVKWIFLSNHIIHFVSTVELAFTQLNLGRLRHLPVHLENALSSLSVTVWMILHVHWRQLLPSSAALKNFLFSCSRITPFSLFLSVHNMLIPMSLTLLRTLWSFQRRHNKPEITVPCRNMLSERLDFWMSSFEIYFKRLYKTLSNQFWRIISRLSLRLVWINRSFWQFLKANEAAIITI